MAEESDVFVRFGADIDPLKKGVEKAGSTLNKLGTQTRSTANQMGKLAAASALAGAAIGVKFVNDSLNAIDAQAKLAKQLGTTSLSISVLERATDRSGISMSNVNTAAKNLEIAMGEAEQGTGVAVDTLERMGLTVKDLEGMTLDQKFLAVNKAIKENIPATQQAAAAADLFGKKAGFAITQLDAATIQEAKREVIGFGVAVSDIDAAKIENANDAMATVGLAVKGVSNQFTVTLAPILEAIANDFKEAAIQTGGFKTAGIEAVQGVGKAVGILGNAFRGIQVIIDGLDVGLSSFKAGWLELGGLFSDEMAKAAQVAQQETSTAVAALNATLMEPLPSEVIEAYIAKLTDSRVIDAKRTQVEELAALDDQAGMQRIAKEEEIQSSMATIRQSWGKQQTTAVGQMFSDLSTLTQSGNKKMFEIGKAAARANVVLSTYEGAQKAYTALAGIPVVGPALGIAAAGAAIAAGGVRLSAINSTSFGGGGSVSSGGAVAAAPTATAPAAAAPEANRTIRLEGIDANQNFSGGQVQQLAESLVELQNDGFKLVI